MSEDYRVEVYQDVAGEWRWRAVEKHSGKIVADGGEGYQNHGDLLDTVEKFLPGIPMLEVDK